MRGQPGKMGGDYGNRKERASTIQQQISEFVLYGDKETKNHFIQNFGTEIEQFIKSIPQVYERITKLESTVPQTMRSAWAWMFLYYAFNNLVTSFHFLISGFIVPSGNLIRQYGESIAMALLCSHPLINVFDRFNSDPGKFPVHKALSIASQKQNARLLNLNRGGWEGFQEITKWYDYYSHASPISIAHLHPFDKPDQMVIGCEFDPLKIDVYKFEIRRRISACNRLLETVEQVERHLKKTGRASG
jgi:hypothetical protein